MSDYDKILARKDEIMKQSIGLDYAKYEYGTIAFDYEALMNENNYSFEQVKQIQTSNMVGNTPLIELKNITKYARKYAKPGYGARIFLKDEAANLSGSFKARRAALAVHHAKQM